jgi:hypothetical protein
MKWGKIMRTIFFLLVSALLLTSAGCSTKSSFQPTPGMEPISTTATMKVGEIKNLSDFAGDSDVPDVSAAMKTALETELTAAGLLKTEGDYTINVNILDYAPGNAFARWMLPGAGSTKLDVDCLVVNKLGKLAATIHVERYIGAGGAYTVGAHSYVFTEVANEIVGKLRNEEKRQPSNT